jgi:hypothetical protein
MSLPSHRLIILCNAFDDDTRLARGVTTDSPAASRKVFLMARKIAHCGVYPLVLSMGRGSANGSGRRHPTQAKRVHGVTTIYMHFTETWLISELISLLAPVGMLWRLRRRNTQTTIVFYNQMVAYIPALIMTKLLGYRAVLDLEDGALPDTSLPQRIADFLRCTLFELLCERAMVACSALGERTRLRPIFCYYGMQESSQVQRDWSAPVVRALFSGSIDRATGATLLASAIFRLQAEKPDWARSLAFDVTGKGEAMSLFASAAPDTAVAAVALHGRTTDLEYGAIVAAAHVGLALKPNSGPLAHTTFPSKVIEMAGAGMLVLTTDISDVRKILGDGANYLEHDDTDLFIDRLRTIVEDRCTAAKVALTGMTMVEKFCDPVIVGGQLTDFLFPSAL